MVDSAAEFAPSALPQNRERVISPMESPETRLSTKKTRLEFIRDLADVYLDDVPTGEPEVDQQRYKKLFSDSKSKASDETRSEYESIRTDIYFQYMLAKSYMEYLAQYKEDEYPNLDKGLSSSERLARARVFAMRNAIRESTRLYKAEKTVAIDHLTGAWSRKALENFIDLHISHDKSESDLLDAEIHEHTTPDTRKTAVLFIDVDHFKKFNDSYGHENGDLVLQEFVHILQGAVRANDIVARYGGEEFSIVLPRISQEDLQMVTDRVLSAIRSHKINLKDGKGTVGITASIGATYISLSDTEAEQSLKRADDQLYLAKKAGRNQVRYDFIQQADAQEEFVDAIAAGA